ncbi:unnamed protein product [Arctia plantaginis]|uniref:Tetraspanin n=1 Tax=Arctia plantaginis TaxID=874455 RepID=A0A8S0ZL25_ARCPL|nr:unnamed protein product [Arctia plantaginis]
MLYFVNGLFLLTGIVLLLIGITVLVRYSQYEELITNRFFNLAGFVIATAVIILIGSVLGFYGAISQHFYVVSGYVIVLLVILVFEIAITIVGYALSDDSVSEIRTTMAESLQLYGTKIEVAQIWDNLQREFECCGVTGRFDWNPITQIPVSCCHIDYGTVSPFQCGMDNAYIAGCAISLGEFLASQAHIFAVAALTMTCIQVILTALGAYLAWRTKYEEVELES